MKTATISFLGVFTIYFLLLGCESDLDKIKIITSRDSLPGATAEQVIIIYSDSGKVQVKADSPEMNSYQNVDNPYVEFPKGIHVDFFDADLEVQSSLTADYAIRYDKERKMEARNNVVVVNNKGDILNTELLVWDEKEEKIRSDKFVKITTPEEVIFGDGFESNQNFTKYKIFKIKGTITLKK